MCLETLSLSPDKFLWVSWAPNTKLKGECQEYIFFSKSTFFHCACVHKKWGLTHRPQSWLTTSGQSSVGSETVRNRGATPKCHHSCKTAEHKSQITEICTPRPPDNENRAAFEWLLPERRSGSRPALCFVGFTTSEELQILQLLAELSVHVWAAAWERTRGRCYRATLPLLGPDVLPPSSSHSAWGRVQPTADYITQTFILMTWMFWLTAARTS